MTGVGTVRRINSERGFGFIRPDFTGRDVFFHVSALTGLEFDDALIERRVEYDVEDHPRGPRATNVRPAV